MRWKEKRDDIYHINFKQDPWQRKEKKKRRWYEIGRDKRGKC